MYRYETHLHTSPVSKCAKASVRESLEFYRALGYDGVFITNHFIGGNVNTAQDATYEEKINFFFSDYEEGKSLEKEIGIKVFAGVEMTYKGTDFLVYGLEREWYLANPQIMDMKMSERLAFLMEAGALVIQAHPYREASYIDHIRLFPRCIHGVEVCNASRNDFENDLALHYADAYGLLKIAGSDNHSASRAKRLGGVECDTPIESEAHFIELVKAGKTQIFVEKNPMRKEE